MGTTAKYIRVSTEDQNTSRQEGSGHREFIDHISGSVPFSDRPAAQKLLKAIEEGGVTEVHVHSIDRLGRSTLDILQTIQGLTNQGVCLVAEKEGLRTLDGDGKPNATATLIINVMASLAQFERSLILERQREGITKAKARGVYEGAGGSVPESVDEFLSKSKNAKCARLLAQGESIRRAAALAGVSKGTAEKVKRLTKTQVTSSAVV